MIHAECRHHRLLEETTAPPLLMRELNRPPPTPTKHRLHQRQQQQAQTARTDCQSTRLICGDCLPRGTIGRRATSARSVFCPPSSLFRNIQYSMSAARRGSVMAVVWRQSGEGSGGSARSAGHLFLATMYAPLRWFRDESRRVTRKQSHYSVINITLVILDWRRTCIGQSHCGHKLWSLDQLVHRTNLVSRTTWAGVSK